VLKLRRGLVIGVEPLEIELDGERRRAWADEGLVGECQLGDEVVVNTSAVDLGLGSGGFDVVHVNLTRGLEGGEPSGGAHVMKLNYTSLQHPVEPIEASAEAPPRPIRRPPLLVLPLHGHLAPASWAAGQERPGLRIGYVQTAGAAVPGSLSRDVDTLRERGLLAGQITVAPCFGGELEAISITGALHAAADELGWDAVIAAPGPGMLGSATRYGHGGMAALDSAHVGLALGLPTLIAPRLSGGDPRPRHLGLSHHTRSVLELLLGGVRVAVPADSDGLWPGGRGSGVGPDELADACGERHAATLETPDLEGYAESGLPRRTMGRDLGEDRLFFAAPLAAGRALVRLLPESAAANAAD
jgi:hypothetical protein